MADLDLAAIRAELAATLRAAAPGVTVYDHTHPQPALPAMHVCGPTRIAYRTVYDGASEITIKITVEVARENHETAQRTLDGLLSRPGPILALEYHDGDSWSELAVQSVSDTRSLGNPANGEVASLAVDVLVDIDT